MATEATMEAKIEAAIQDATAAATAAATEAATEAASAAAPQLILFLRSPPPPSPGDGKGDSKLLLAGWPFDNEAMPKSLFLTLPELVSTINFVRFLPPSPPPGDGYAPLDMRAEARPRLTPLPGGGGGVPRSLGLFGVAAVAAVGSVALRKLDAHAGRAKGTAVLV